MNLEQIILVRGKWIYEKHRWFFVVDSKRGSRILKANGHTRFDDFIDMVYDDYGLDKQMCDVKLSYMFPKKILLKLPQDTPPVFVENGSQFQSFLGQLKSEIVRLCVEVNEKVVVEGDEDCKRQSKRPKEEEASGCKHKRLPVEEQEEDARCDTKNNSVRVEDQDEDARFDYCDDSDGTNSDDENYTIYGMSMEDEQRSQQLPMKKRSFVNERNLTKEDEFVRLEMSSLNLAVGQCYETKHHLETRLKMITVLQKFDFDVERSTPILLIVKCWVKGCMWRVRASPIGDYPKFHVRIYVQEHTCSITNRSARARQASPEILGAIYKDFVGGVEPTVLPMHVAEALNKRFQIKVADLFVLT